MPAKAGKLPNASHTLLDKRPIVQKFFEAGDKNANPTG